MRHSDERIQILSSGAGGRHQRRRDAGDQIAETLLEHQPPRRYVHDRVAPEDSVVDLEGQTIKLLLRQYPHVVDNVAGLRIDRILRLVYILHMDERVAKRESD